ncbi:ribosome biosynthesis protein nip7 [Collariella sp. IMI 366227]|nr:ribosome biosynthesis protein nip7 [Collariella sp. IMI 366227]
MRPLTDAEMKTVLDKLANYMHKIWVKENGAQPFLYGSNVVKAHVGRWSEDCPEHQGCVIYSMADVPLGFGVTARSTNEARRLDPTGIVCFRQADCGEYLRDEDTLFAG